MPLHVEEVASPVQAPTHTILPLVCGVYEGITGCLGPASSPAAHIAQVGRELGVNDAQHPSPAPIQPVTRGGTSSLTAVPRVSPRPTLLLPLLFVLPSFFVSKRMGGEGINKN